MSADSELQALYRELVLDHARNPRNFGKLPAASHCADGINPLCGDKLHLYLQIADERIAAAQFEGSGCAISMASASLMTEAVRNMDPATAHDCVATVTRRLTADEDPKPFEIEQLEKLQALDGVRAYPSRVKCATLAWHALGAALDEKTTPATTE